MTSLMENEINRLISISDSNTPISYRNYVRNENFVFVESHKAVNDNLNWIRSTYESICSQYGYMPIEVAYNKNVYYSQINIFYTIKVTNGKPRKQYFAIYIKGGLI